MFDWLEKNVIWLIPAAPLAACLWIVVVGHVVRRKYAHRPLVAGLVVSWLASLFLLTVVVPGGFSHDEHKASHAVMYPEDQSELPSAEKHEKPKKFEWIKVGDIDVNFVLRADAMSALMLTMVTTVSLLVAIFASGYMTGDPGYPRFFASMALFVFSMCMLVLAGNFLLMFVFWEAVGLCSYLLIGFWYQKPSAAAAAKKAFVVNRIGDFGFILGILLIWQTFGTLDFETWFGSPEMIADQASGASPRSFTGSVSCCLWAPSENRLNSRCRSGYLTRWKARPQSQR